MPGIEINQIDIVRIAKIQPTVQRYDYKLSAAAVSIRKTTWLYRKLLLHGFA